MRVATDTSASEASRNSHPLSWKGGWGDSQSVRGPAAYDGDRPVAIVGGGPAGMALALALKLHGIEPEIFEARERAAVRRDPRVLALSDGARQILDWLGVWADLPATPIETIHISQRGGFGRTVLRACATTSSSPHGRRDRTVLSASCARSWARRRRVSEMVTSNSLLYGSAKTQRRADHDRRGRSDLGADRRRRSGDDGRGREVQRRQRRADHRHQHGLSGQEGLQRDGRLGADAGRAAGRAHPRGRGEARRAAYPGHAQVPHRLEPRQQERSR
jgi:hypothetical protein